MSADSSQRSSSINLGDLLLSGILYELHYLDENYCRIEEQIRHLKAKAEEMIQDEYGDLSQPDEGECHLALDELHHNTTVVIPRLIRHSFLVSLYAVYEAAVIEIAEFIRVRQSQPITLDDLKGRFPRNARKYYKDVLGFKLVRDNVSWQKVCLLARLRHAIVHANGRLDRLRSDDDRKQIKQTGGIVVDGPKLMIIGSDLLDDVFVAVKGDLDDLVSRYKEWDSGRQN